MRATQRISILLWLGIWCCHSHAIGLPHFNLDDVVDRADLIVVADVTQSRDIGPAPLIQFRNQLLEAEGYSAEACVKETIKGPHLNCITVTYPLPKTFIGYTGPHPGLRILFLHTERDQYSFADPYYPDLPAVLEVSEEKLGSENYSEAVLRNILGVLASPTASAQEKDEILRFAYALPSNSTTVAALKQGLTTSTDPEFIWKLQSELIRFGDLSQLPSVANVLLQGSATQNGQQWLLYAIGTFIKDPHAIPALQLLVHAPNDSIRESSVQALWHTGAASATPELIRALEDPDERVRFYAVRGLSDIANEYGWGGPSEPEFHEHSQKYLTHWQEWAKNRAH